MEDKEVIGLEYFNITNSGFKPIFILQIHIVVFK